MSYVDLNPIRAKLCDSPEMSDFTSIQARIRAYQKKAATPPALQAFAEQSDDSQTPVLPFTREDYLQLVDAAGRVIRDDKAHAIPAHLHPILDRLQLDSRTWLDHLRHFSKRFFYYVGHSDEIDLAAASCTGAMFGRGKGAAKTMYKAA